MELGKTLKGTIYKLSVTPNLGEIDDKHDIKSSKKTEYFPQGEPTETLVPLNFDKFDDKHNIRPSKKIEYFLHEDPTKTKALDIEIWSHIISFLPNKDLLKTMLINRIFLAKAKEILLKRLFILTPEIANDRKKFKLCLANIAESPYFLMVQIKVKLELHQAKQLAEALNKNGKLQILDLSCKDFAIIGSWLEKLINKLQPSEHLKKLALRGGNIVREIEILFPLLKNLEILDLSDNSFSYSGTNIEIDLLVKALKSNQNLRKLVLSGCHISSKQVRVLERLFPLLKNLQELNLYNNPINDTDLEFILKALQSSNNL